MVQIVNQTKEEKIAMYMKCPKKQLAEMLWACNTLIESYSPIVSMNDIINVQNVKKRIRIKNHKDPNFRETV